jgi:hypothetical protein
MRDLRILVLLAVVIFTWTGPGQRIKRAQQNAPCWKQTTQRPIVRVVDLKGSDGTLLMASYFAAAKPGPGVLLYHQYLFDIWWKE